MSGMPTANELISHGLTVRQVARPIWIAAAVVMTADALSTYLALELHTGAREVHPIMAPAIELLGPALALTLKALLGIFIAWMAACRIDHGYRWDFAYRLRLAFWRGPLTVQNVQRSAAWGLVIYFTVTCLVVGGNIHAIVAPLIIESGQA